MQNVTPVGIGAGVSLVMVSLAILILACRSRRIHVETRFAPDRATLRVDAETTPEEDAPVK